MSENAEPEGTQPPPGAGDSWGMPPHAAGGEWSAATPPSVPSMPFASPGPGGGTWGTQGGPWGATSYAWGVPPPPARPARTARVHVIWLMVALVTALGCGTAGFVIGKSSDQISAAIKSSGAAAGATPCADTSPAPSAGTRLAGKLLPVPRGARYLKGRYRRQVDSLDQFVRELYPQAPSFEKRRLVARCFRVATQQGWVLPSGRAVAVYLVQFGTRADARSYALAVQSADLADPRNKLHGAVRGVSDGILIEAPKLDKYGNTLSRMIGDKGNVAMIIHIFVPAHLPSRTSAMFRCSAGKPRGCDVRLQMLGTALASREVRPVSVRRARSGRRSVPWRCPGDRHVARSPRSCAARSSARPAVRPAPDAVPAAWRSRQRRHRQHGVRGRALVTVEIDDLR